MAKSKIAYCIAAYNAADYIIDCIESIQMQNNNGKWKGEIFITDDCSTDNTAAVIKSFRKVHLYKTETNSQGMCAIPKNISIINAVRVMDCDFIVTMDADDMLEPDFTNSLLQTLMDNPDKTWATCNGTMFGSRTGILRPIPNKTFQQMRVDNGITSWAMIRRLPFWLGSFYNEVLHEDYDLWIRFLKANKKYAVVDKALYKYRVHPNQKTNNIDQQLALKQIIDKHFK